ncbi:hypothetical protein DRO42_08455, partial [Candidatus Bathyarchaeota archaeon]
MLRREENQPGDEGRLERLKQDLERVKEQLNEVAAELKGLRRLLRRNQVQSVLTTVGYSGMIGGVGLLAGNPDYALYGLC